MVYPLASGEVGCVTCVTPLGILFQGFPDFSQEYIFFNKNRFMPSERISRYGCMREVWRARKKHKSYALNGSSFLSALQISQVHHIAKKNACLLIVNLILVTRGTEKQTLLLPHGYKHATIV